MHRAARYALLAAVAVALLSVAANHAVTNRGPPDPASCGSAELSVYEYDGPSGETVAYESLSDRERTAVDTARNRSNRTARVDPTVAAGLPDAVTIDGTRYRASTSLRDCPLVPGVPRALDRVVAVLFGLYHFLSPLYLPAGVLVAVVLGYSRVDEWLRFD